MKNKKYQLGGNVDFSQFVKQLPDTVPGNGGDYIRQKQANGTYKYFIDAKDGSNYRPESDYDEWMDNALRYKGYLPQYDEDYENIISMKPMEAGMHKQYMSELGAVSNINNSNYTGPRPTGVRSQQTGGRFQDLNERQILDLGYNPSNAPAGTTFMDNGMIREDGWRYVAKGDSIGTDGSRWNVKYTYNHDGSNRPEASYTRVAREILPDGSNGRKQTRQGTVPLNQNEVGVWGGFFPEEKSGFWRLNNEGKLVMDKFGGSLNYLNYINNVGRTI